MRKVNYDEISSVYDQVGRTDVDELTRFIDGAKLSETSAVLDIGCGTGNYSSKIKKLTGARTYGIDTSEGMLRKAAEKDPETVFKLGSATDIPFVENFFDFVYMADVVHHVIDLERMFTEIRRVLKPGGKLCIDTQSHAQIDVRHTSEFFPSTVEVDKKRYPTIRYMTETAESAGFAFVKKETVNQGKDVEIGREYLELVEKKGYSVFRLIPEGAYDAGLKRLRDELKGGSVTRKSAGITLVWFEK